MLVEYFEFGWGALKCSAMILMSVGNHRQRAGKSNIPRGETYMEEPICFRHASVTSLLDARNCISTILKLDKC